ncbi:hypothetical protein ACMSE3_26535 [Bacteroides thetaiotaomicron]|uniref:hypothetical protein n=1 Tax=Bacteroides thetaiotaomicron TaxID=818 RepID=UPI0039C1EB8F
MNIIKQLDDALTKFLDKFYISEVNKDVENIYHMVNPSKNVLIALAEKAPEYIPYIQENYPDKLTEEVKQAIIQNNPATIEYFQDASEVLQLVAVTKDPSTIVAISNPYPNVQVTAVQRNPELIKSIVDPCEEARLISVKERWGNISQIEDPTEQEMLAAVNGDSSSILYINYSSEDVKLAAVNDNAYNILKIRNPQRVACKAAIQKEFGNINIPDQNIRDATITLFSKMEETNRKYDEMWLRADYADDFEDKLREWKEADSWKKDQLSKALQEFTEGGDSKLHINPDQREKVTDNDIKDLRIEAIQILQGNAPERFFEDRFEGIREQFAYWSERLYECLNNSETGKSYNNIRMMSDEFFIKKEIERTCIVIASEMRESFNPDDFSENVSVLFKADNLEIGKVPTIEEALSLFSHKYLLPKDINSAVFENEVSGQYEIIRPNIQYDVFDNRNFQLMNAGTNPYSPHYKELFDNLGLKKEFNEFEKKCVERDDNWNGSYFYAVATHDIAEIYDLDRELPILDQNIEDSRKVLYEGMVQKISNDKDHEFRSAFEEGNNVKLSALKSEGYMPSHEVMQSLSRPFSDSTTVVVQKLFGIEAPDHSGIQPVQSEIKADIKHHLSNAEELTL